MKKYIRGIIYILFSLLKFSFIKIFHFLEFRFTLLNLFSPFTEVDLDKGAFLILKKSVKAKSGVKIKVRKGARVEIGEKTSFNHGCMIVSHNNIIIGNDVQFGPNVFLYDHDHDFRKKDGLKNLEYKSAPIIIGNNVWVGANVVILRGTTIGDNCVIGAGAVIKGAYSSNSIIVQKREEVVTHFTN